MSRTRTRLVVAVFLVAACTDRSHITAPAPDPGKGLSASAGKNGGGTATFAYTMTGDVFTTGSAPTARMQVNNPFYNLSTSPAVVTLGTPSGDTTVCRTASPTQNFAADFGNFGGTSWSGTLKIPNTGTLSFLGTDASGRTMQFSVGDLTGGPTLSLASDGNATYAYTNAALFFGGNSVAYDGKYRCVNITVRATP